MKKTFRSFYLGFILSLGIFLVLPAKEIHAYGPWSNSYLLYGRRGINDMPELLFSAACGRLLELDLFECVKEFPSKLEEEIYENSNRAVLATFEETFLREHVGGGEVPIDSDTQAGMDGYHAFREALSQYVRYDFKSNRHRYWKENEKQDPFDITPFKATLEALPAQFSLYAYGAVAYRNQDWPAAIEHFSKLLALPEEQRACRSVRASFMLGKSYLEESPSEAIRFFRQTRRLAARGFLDPVNLAEASYGWQARAEMLSGDYLSAIHHYASVEGGDTNSLRRVAHKALSAEKVDAVLVQDPLAQRILTAWLVAYPQATEEAEKWLEAIEVAKRQGADIDVEYLAWLCYNRGDWKGADRWIACSGANAPISRWLKSKLLLREGDMEGAIALLKEVDAQLSGVQPWRNDYRIKYPDPDGRAISAELAFLQLHQGDYIDSLRSFLKNMNYLDATFLAERILTLDELRNFVKRYPQKEKKLLSERYYKRYYNSHERYAQINMRYILARRLAREGYWQEALEYYLRTVNERYKTKEVMELAKKIVALRRAAQDTENTAAERAEHLYNIGIILREDGQGLLSPILSPRDSDYCYSMECIPPDLEARFQASLKTYPLRNYSRHIAADYMWQCAELLPDNNLRAAEALFKGGSWLKYKAPEEADRFYKALVRRNPNLLIAQEADELRWFPKAFTDKPARATFPPSAKRLWYDRKRYLAGGILGGLCFIVLGIVGLGKVRRKQI